MGVWEEHAYTRKDDEGNIVSLEEYNRTHKVTGLSRVMTAADFKLYAICGVGFFLDAYDLFIINLVTPIWAFEYFGGLKQSYQPVLPFSKQAIPFLLRGAVNAAANIGNVIGQLSFGFLGDAFGRKFVYGKELIVAMVGIILVISMPNHVISPGWHKMWWAFGFRLLMGIGIGGDYPMSAAIVAERSTLQNRGRMLAWIFSNQGWGTLTASIITLFLLGCFKHALTNGALGQVDAIWRLQIGFALIPACALLYFRLTMPEGRKFQQSTELSTVAASSLANSTSSFDSIDAEKQRGSISGKILGNESVETERRVSMVEAHAAPPAKNVQMTAFLTYFSEWRHLKILIGTASTWFLVDISFYGTNLNQSVILADIGYTASGNSEYQRLLTTAIGNLIIAAAGYVPGYFFTIAFIEILGRKPIQIGGFLITGLMFGILAGDYHLGTASKFALFTIAQLFFNFGPNATTFIVPGEVFPSRVRGLAHGVSAAIGKLGAILAGVLFNYLSSYKIGLNNTLWIFFGCSILGAIMTVLFVPETKGIDADDIDYQECQEMAARRMEHHNHQ